MPIDPYSPCPGGLDKKIKFCCPDIVGDLEQIERLIEGDQIAAALDQTRRLAAKHPGKACLFATQTKLELATRGFTEAAATNKAFLEAFPDNPLAIGQGAVMDAIAGNVQEAATRFDKAREACRAEVSPEFVRIAATLVQAAAQAGHVGCAQGIVEWLIDRDLGALEDRRLLAAIVGSSGVPPALRTKVHLEPADGDESWRPDFDTALGHAQAWRLSRALMLFRSLKGVAATCPAVFVNIAVLCEMLAKPFEASEAWLAVAKLRGDSHDDAVEATGRAIALETEADPDRSPLVNFCEARAQLTLEGPDALDLLEDRVRHEPHCEPAPFDRSEWVQRGAAPPHSVWRVYSGPADASPRARLLASLMLFGRQTDREPEARLQGFAPDVTDAMPIVAALLGTTLAVEPPRDGLPVASPTGWLLGTQFRATIPKTGPEPAKPGELAMFDTIMEQQRTALWQRFESLWPTTPLPELLGKTPKEAVARPDARLRVEALLSEGEATGRRADVCDAWARIRTALGIPTPATIESDNPLDEVPPLRWHRLDLARLAIDQLRGLLLTAVDAGFELAAERVAREIVARDDATPEDRGEAYGFLEQRATSTTDKLAIIASLREIAAALKASTGMLDVAEMRIRLQRGDQADMVRLLDHVRRHHARDQRVITALAEVLMEAGIDLSAGAGRMPPGAMPGEIGRMPGAAAAPATAPAAEAGKLWTPGGEQAGGGGEKKIWTPG